MYRTMPSILLLLSIVFSANSSAASEPIRTMGEETIGNKPLNAHNYTDWPKIMPVANHTSRVYHTWVNGDERFYYKCDAKQLNDLLENFGKTDQAQKEVVLLPGPSSTTNFKGDKSFSYNCSMHLVGGIAKHVAKKDKGTIFWPAHPQLTIRIDKDFDFKALRAPENCRLVAPSELKQRYIEGLKSTDQTIRGWGISYLVQVDPYDTKSLDIVIKKLDDKVDWVALNALSSLPKFGSLAYAHLPRLQEIADGDIEQNAKRANEAIESIKRAGQELSTEEKNKKDAHGAVMKKIEAFLDNEEGGG